MEIKTQQTDKNKQSFINLIDQMHLYKTSAVSVAVIDQGRIAWSQAYGTVSFENAPTTTETLFQAASLSKPVTAMGALLLVQQNRLSLDEDVNTYLQSWKIPDHEYTTLKKVTLRQLLSHTAGTFMERFPGYRFDQSIPTLVEVLEGKKPHVATAPLCMTSVPGEKHCYSNGGITVVQLLIEEITGEKFEVWMHNNVLIPFGMHASTFGQPTGSAACGHHGDGSMVPGKWHIYPEKAAAGLWTTPTDLAQFTVMLNVFEGPLHKEFIQEALKVQCALEYGGQGLGFFVYGSGKESWFGHNGCNTGFLSNLIVYPELGKGWVIMVNNDGASGLMQEVKKSIADVYF